MDFDFESVKSSLSCPKSHSKLIRDGDRLVSVDSDNRLAYDIVDQIPRLLLEHATELPEGEWQAIIEKQCSSLTKADRSSHSQQQFPLACPPVSVQQIQRKSRQ